MASGRRRGRAWIHRFPSRDGGDGRVAGGEVSECIVRSSANAVGRIGGGHRDGGRDDARALAEAARAGIGGSAGLWDGDASYRDSACMNASRQGQLVGRCSVNLRAERVMRPGRVR